MKYLVKKYLHAILDISDEIRGSEEVLLTDILKKCTKFYSLSEISKTF